MSVFSALGVCVFLMLSLAPAWAEQSGSQEVTQQMAQAGASMKLTVDKTSIGIAEKLRYELVVDTDADMTADFDGVSDRFGSFQVVERNAFGPIVLEDQRLRWQREYVLLPTDVGTAVLPPLSVAFLPSKIACVSADDCELSAHGRRSASHRAPTPAFVLNTDPIDILVDTVLPPDVDLTRPRDVLAPLSIGTVQTETVDTVEWGWMLAGLAAMMAVAFGFIRSRSTVLPVQNAAVALPDPAARTLSALADLRGEGLPGLGRHDEHCSRLNDILRSYFNEGFNIPALELTTGELGNVINQHGQLQSEHLNIKQLLVRTDLARFGHQYPEPNQSLNMIEQTENVVRATAPGAMR